MSHCGTLFLLIYVDDSNCIRVFGLPAIFNVSLTQSLSTSLIRIKVSQCVKSFLCFVLALFSESSLYALTLQKAKIYLFVCLFFQIKMNGVVELFVSKVKSHLKRSLDLNRCTLKSAKRDPLTFSFYFLNLDEIDCPCLSYT